MVIAAVIGVYGSLVKYATESSAFYFLLIITALLLFCDKLPKVPERWRGYYAGSGAVLALLAFGVGWDNGGIHRFAEAISCDLRLPFCDYLKSARIAQTFRPIEFEGFNSRIEKPAVEQAKAFCKQQGGTEAIVFRLRNAHNTAYTVSYKLQVLGNEWTAVAHDPIADGNGQIDIGRMDAQDRITRSPLRFPDNVGRVTVRVCLISKNLEVLTPSIFSPERVLDLATVAVQPG